MNKTQEEFLKREEQFIRRRRIERIIISSEPNWGLRILKYAGHFFIYPFVWAWNNLRDWETIVIFAIVLIAVSSEVWIFYLVALLTWGTEFSKWAIGIGSTLWAFWLAPATPFLPLCVAVTMGIKRFLVARRKRIMRDREFENN